MNASWRGWLLGPALVVVGVLVAAALLGGRWLLDELQDEPDEAFRAAYERFLDSPYVGEYAVNNGATFTWYRDGNGAERIDYAQDGRETTVIVHDDGTVIGCLNSDTPPRCTSQADPRLTPAYINPLAQFERRGLIDIRREFARTIAGRDATCFEAGFTRSDRQDVCFDDASGALALFRQDYETIDDPFEFELRALHSPPTSSDFEPPSPLVSD